MTHSINTLFSFAVPCSDLLRESCGICAAWKEVGYCEITAAKLLCLETCGHCKKGNFTKEKCTLTMLTPRPSGNNLRLSSIFFSFGGRSISVGNAKRKKPHRRLVQGLPQTLPKIHCSSHQCFSWHELQFDKRQRSINRLTKMPERWRHSARVHLKTYMYLTKHFERVVT